MPDAAPLFDALRRFVERDQAPFYSPGHKGGRTLDPWFRENIAAVDLNNLPDTDTLHCPQGPILAAERLIADAWGVPQSFILVQGSTGGNIAVALASLRADQPVLVARNAHKSVLAGLVAVSGSTGCTVCNPNWRAPDTCCASPRSATSTPTWTGWSRVSPKSPIISDDATQAHRAA
jgi:arginine/lysine/ornithine decarboxylase